MKPAGRSTLQNEIIGDLTKEFGSLPDQPEDIPLAEMGAGLAESGVGQKLGACTSSLVSKLASTKMPAGSGAASLRQYLEGRWGFKQGLQDRALLASIARQPTSRLGDAKQMESFLDDLAQTVLRDVGVDPASLSSQSGQASASASTAISSEALEALQREQRADDKKMLELYAKRCGQDLDAAGGEVARQQKTIDELQSKVDAWEAEHGDAYEKGIQPKFDARKARRYDSYWNWVIQDLVATFSGLLHGNEDVVKEDAQARTARFQTRSTTRLLDAVQYLLNSLSRLPDTEGKPAAREWLVALQQACQEAKANSIPIFKYSVPSMVPVLEIDDKGKISVEEVPRDQATDYESLSSLEDLDDGNYLQIEGFSASSVGGSGTSTPLRSGVSSAMARSVSSGASSTSALMDSPMPGPVNPVSRVTTFSLGSPQPNLSASPPAPQFCPEPSGMAQIKTKGPDGWRRDHMLTRAYLRWFQSAATKGVSFADHAVLVTGAGQRSIGAEIVRMLLSAGAKVLVTTSSYSPAALEFYETLYRAHGASGAELVVVPFNGGSSQDTTQLVSYVYDVLGWDLDHVVPFAAVGEAGRPIDAIDGHSELSHRVMLTNLVRLLGAVKVAKATRSIDTHPTHVVLPLSPNHGIFGQDGLYAESKIGLEAMLNKWWSEDWNDYLTLCGAVIGWTRGTGLMSNNDVLATGIEEDLRVRTFSATEMAWHIVGLMDEAVAGACDMQPLMADLSGGLKAEMNLKPMLDRIQQGINAKSEVRKAVARDLALEAGLEPAAGPVKRKLQKRANLRVERSSLPAWDEIAPLNAQLEGMVDLERVVVAVGFGEIGESTHSHVPFRS
jgi:fatty acid synthase subunit alpha, fungi type